MTDPLSYDSLYDPHLQTYFQNKNIRKHLRKVGLINRYDEIIPDKQYKAIIKIIDENREIRSRLSSINHPSRSSTKTILSARHKSSKVFNKYYFSKNIHI
ncbi:unnamed protein product [Rotaria sordida]|uniref:Uncharacterized protein n=1 Tax=Rotaria sordida TaxID=392033 RepID=A0A815EBJ1_9BILA|nr:unnamed protein product [Rotaria sordida]